MKYFALCLILITLNAYSSNNEPHPVIDSSYSPKYTYDIENMNLEELKKNQIIIGDYLKNNNKIKSTKSMDKKLLDALLKYDDERILITNVIDEIIIEYKVNAEIKKTLLSFKETFKITTKENRYLVKNLRDYKSYDFRLGAAYLAMMSALHETEESKKLYSNLVRDKKNVDTSIGRYSKNLKLAQKEVNAVRLEIEYFKEIREARVTLVKIEKEISSRN